MMKLFGKLILALIFALYLTGCIVTVNNNWGSDIHTIKAVDDIGIAQKYDTDMQKGNRK